MRRLVLALILLAVAILPDPASCIYCPTYTCYGRCGSRCVCLVPPGSFGGECWGIDRASLLVSEGYSIVE